MYVCELVFYMEENYKRNTKKHLGCLIALAMVFSFTSNSLAQCGTVTIDSQINASCYGLTGTAVDGSIDVTAVGGTGYYHYILEILL